MKSMVTIVLYILSISTYAIYSVSSFAYTLQSGSITIRPSNTQPNLPTPNSKSIDTAKPPIQGT
jgi:hypothetical protein